MRVSHVIAAVLLVAVSCGGESNSRSVPQKSSPPAEEPVENAGPVTQRSSCATAVKSAKEAAATAHALMLKLGYDDAAPIGEGSWHTLSHLLPPAWPPTRCEALFYVLFNHMTTGHGAFEPSAAAWIVVDLRTGETRTGELKWSRNAGKPRSRTSDSQRHTLIHGTSIARETEQRLFEVLSGVRPPKYEDLESYRDEKLSPVWHSEFVAFLKQAPEGGGDPEPPPWAR